MNMDWGQIKQLLGVFKDSNVFKYFSLNLMFLRQSPALKIIQNIFIRN